MEACCFGTDGLRRRQAWQRRLFDFGYQYRFDPLTQFNSAGNGRDCPQFHLAERIIGRNLSGQLLALDAGAARQALGDFIAAAWPTYASLRQRLAARGAAAPVLAWLDGLIATWREGLEHDPQRLFLQLCWQAHASDLEDDLRGQTCTPRTLQRADWLMQTLRRDHAALQRSGALSAAEAALSSTALLAHYQRLGQ